MKYVNFNYKKIIAVESSKKNFDTLCKNLSNVNNIEFFNIGIFSKRTKLSFVVSDAKNSFQSDSGTEIIDVDSIDNILKDNSVTFIKMDIEGAEYDALIGAKNTLKRDIPILAISVYHKVEDLYRLQLLIDDICPNKYNYYLRHYSPTIIETILYALPKLEI